MKLRKEMLQRGEDLEVQVSRLCLGETGERVEDAGVILGEGDKENVSEGSGVGVNLCSKVGQEVGAIGILKGLEKGEKRMLGMIMGREKREGEGPRMRGNLVGNGREWRGIMKVEIWRGLR